VAYIQQYIPIDRDIRVVVIGGHIVHSYWRIAATGEFRTNVAAGGRICFDNIPEKALALAKRAAQVCRWDDVGIDLCRQEDGFVILEANMKYGKEGFRAAGMNYSRIMEQMIEDERI
jgi:ribosomal protein S6--L-glutamate ligase